MRAPVQGLSVFLWVRNFAGEQHEYTKDFEKAFRAALDDAGYRVTTDKKKAAQYQLWATVFIDHGKRAFADLDVYDGKAAHRLDTARYEEPAPNETDLTSRLAVALVNKLNASSAFSETAHPKKNAR